MHVSDCGENFFVCGLFGFSGLFFVFCLGAWTLSIMKRTVSGVTCQILEILQAVRVLEWLPM